VTVDVDIADLTRERDAEDELLALLARGVREAADSQHMPILRLINADEAPTEGFD
jgi:hypothetical protein